MSKAKVQTAVISVLTGAITFMLSVLGGYYANGVVNGEYPNPLTSQVRAEGSRAWEGDAVADWHEAAETMVIDRPAGQTALLCTAGIPIAMHDGGQVTQATITAAHCLEDGLLPRFDGPSALTDAGTHLVDERDDIAIARVPGGAPFGHVFANITEPVEGMNVCLHGRTSGRRCGVITDVDSTSFIVNVPSRAGDSGGPAYTGNSALGVVSSTMVGPRGENTRVVRADTLVGRIHHETSLSVTVTPGAQYYPHSEYSVPTDVSFTPSMMNGNVVFPPAEGTYVESETARAKMTE